MQHLIIAIVLVIGPNHELLGGKVLPGASDTMEACYKKVAAFMQQVGTPPEDAVMLPACAELSKGAST